jgi:streptomycin 6-kinase
MPLVSPAFKERIRAVHDQTGQNWLEALPGLLDQFILRFDLRDIQPVPDLSYHYLVFGSTTGNQPVVLKFGVPHRELETGIRALRAFNGHGSVQLLAADPDAGVLLLERILPGTELRTVAEDQEATRIAAGVMKRLWLPAPAGDDFPTARDWCQGFQHYLKAYPTAGPLPIDQVRNASRLAEELLASSQDQLLLHGDLHHQNILWGEHQGWIAIDPQGVIGEACFEVGALILNPVPDLIRWPGLKDIQSRRLWILEEALAVNRERLAAWSYVRAVLSAIWSVTDHQDWRSAIRVAEILRDLI